MIQVTNLTFNYPGTNVKAVDNISFRVKQGEIFGFLGPSGAGKSTTQKLLTRLLRGHSGEITIAGKPIERWDNSFYSQIGVGFELPNHYLKLTALENLGLFGSLYPGPIARPMDMLTLVDLQDHAGKRVGEFSKGMKMRLSFVRALMHNPPVLFLDEPTSGLDPGYSRVIKDIIKQKKSEGKTIFLTTHNMHDAEELCDRVAFMADGQLRLTGEPAAIRAHNKSLTIAVELMTEGGVVRKEFLSGTLSSDADFLQTIDDPCILSIHSGEETLEDVFIRTTGKKLTTNE